MDAMATEAHFEAIVDTFVGTPAVTLGGGRRGFGSDALQAGGRIFAMTSGGLLVLKLPAARVAALVASGEGEPFDAGRGRPMKEWVVVVRGGRKRCLALAREACAFVLHLTEPRARS